MRITLLAFLIFVGCGSDKDTVIEKAPTTPQEPPLTKCDEAHALADSKIVECGFADPGVRVMVCSALGWTEAYNTCKAPPPRSTGGILGTGPVTEPEEKEETKPGPILPPPPKPTTPAQAE